ncbi:zeta-coat protein, putative [Ixodes scapularis]|uniref:Coatomer subunit zeta n=1 Tax=Ixodes scapularis TaxID=6945 RepID=B7P3E7_IXOSC|nr:zeta-coat protein, putative [Ixodes scapularis]|eukprot:XP_002404043.1 zeta-coat protein, putative [Ixodes scapularis]
MPFYLQYYDNTFPSVKEQKAFEKNLFNKTHRANAEIIMLDGLTCVYRSNVDLFFYVMGSNHENETVAQVFQSAKEQLKWSLLK